MLLAPHVVSELQGPVHQTPLHSPDAQVALAVQGSPKRPSAEALPVVELLRAPLLVELPPVDVLLEGLVAELPLVVPVLEFVFAAALSGPVDPPSVSVAGGKSSMPKMAPQPTEPKRRP